MALTLAILPGFDTVSVTSDTDTFIASVTNSGTTSVTLSALYVYGDPKGNIITSPPQYLTPNVPVGVGNPVLLPGVTYYYPFAVNFVAPNISGPSPQAPGGSGSSGIAANPANTSALITLNSLSSDSTVASVSLLVPVLSAIAPFPVAQGGGAQFSSGFNAINFLTSFA